jgi:magnesium chelatase family protein
VEVTRLHGLAGQFSGLASGGLITEPPFRSPHHSASVEGVLGGGRNIRPGEITLANLGTLFLDEAPEFRLPVLQSLREPLEDRVITIVRAEGPQKLPADFQLVMAANSCPCGRLGATLRGSDSEGQSTEYVDSRRGFNPSPIPYENNVPGRIADSAGYVDSGCFCTGDEIRRYWRKMGSALLDRIEIRVPVRAPGVLTPAGEGGERSEDIRRRVAAAEKKKKKRFAGLGVRRNSRMVPGQIEKFCSLSKSAEEAFILAAAKLGLSGRACHGVLKIARTIADLEGNDAIESIHVLEAVQHRRFGDDPYDILSV